MVVENASLNIRSRIELQPIQLRRISPQHSFTVFSRQSLETMSDGFAGARPCRIGERQIGRPQDAIGADVIGERCDRIVPGVEKALALEHLQRREIVTLTGETVMFELVIGPF
jgi:hypothetical protein